LDAVNASDRVNIEASDTTTRSAISPRCVGPGGGEVCHSSLPDDLAADQSTVEVPKHPPREVDREYWIASSVIAIILIGLFAMLVIAVGQLWPWEWRKRLNGDPEAAAALMKLANEDVLQQRPLGKAINNVKNNSAELLA
jgi:hypothetical protein